MTCKQARFSMNQFWGSQKDYLIRGFKKINFTVCSKEALSYKTKETPIICIDRMDDISWVIIDTKWSRNHENALPRKTAIQTKQSKIPSVWDMWS